MNKTLSLLAAALMMTSLSFAGEAVSSKKVVIAPDDCRFHANEWQIDASTVGSSGVYGGQGKQSLGGNLGVNYFFSKYLGVGVDNSVAGYRNAAQTGGVQAIDRLQADLLLRYPICSWNLAPYVMVGGGAAWGPLSQGNGNVGGGIEWRFMSNLGFFADCRWLYGNNGSASLTAAMPRAGFRFSF